MQYIFISTNGVEMMNTSANYAKNRLSLFFIWALFVNFSAYFSEWNSECQCTARLLYCIHCVKVDGTSGQGGFGGQTVLLSGGGPFVSTVQKQHSHGRLSTIRYGTSSQTFSVWHRGSRWQTFWPFLSHPDVGYLQVDVQVFSFRGPWANKLHLQSGMTNGTAGSARFFSPHGHIFSRLSIQVSSV